MGTVEKNRRIIDLNQLEGVEEMFFRQVQMDGAKVLKKFKGLYEETRALSYEKLSSESVFDSFKIEKIEGDTVFLEGGTRIPSEMMARVFQNSEEAVVCAITIFGYEEIEDGDGDFMKAFFLDGWGTALVECGFSQLKKELKEELEKQQLYSTCSWSPGQHNVDIQLQKVVFDLIGPEEIGITLNDNCMMHPKKSISGFFGIGPEKNLETIRACDFCEHRETCPNAYAG